MTEAIKDPNTDLSYKARSPHDHRKWTQEEENFLRENYAELGAKATGEKLNRTVNAVYVRARTLGVAPTINRKWTKAEDDFLREHYAELGPTKASKAIDRGLEATRSRAYALGALSKRERDWTIKEDNFIRLNLSLIHI